MKSVINQTEQDDCRDPNLKQYPEARSFSQCEMFFWCDICDKKQNTRDPFCEKGKWNDLKDLIIHKKLMGKAKKANESEVNDGNPKKNQKGKQVW